jgi:DNA polymerase
LVNILRLDFETRSAAKLSGQESVGLHNYMSNESTRALMLAYKLPSAKTVDIWFPHEGPMPAELRAAILDPDVLISAFNSAFERYALEYLCGIKLHPSRFTDPQVSCRYLTLPASLGEAGVILGMPAHLLKSERGEELIELFSKPHYTRKKKGEERKMFFNDWNTHPNEWLEFADYCIQDVIAEEEIARRCEILEALPLPPFERKLWIFDQVVNDRGIPVDVEFVEKAYKLGVRAKEEAIAEQDAISGLENSNSTTQLLPWVRQRGYPYNTLGKDFVDAVLKDPGIVLSEECRKVLTLRRAAASTTYTKLAKILKQVSKDGRLRNQFLFMGSTRCARWSGNAVQLHNMARPDKTFESRKNLVDARALIRAEDYEGIKERFKDAKTGKPGSVLLVIKNCIRTVFIAP